MTEIAVLGTGRLTAAITGLTAVTGLENGERPWRLLDSLSDLDAGSAPGSSFTAVVVITDRSSLGLQSALHRHPVTTKVAWLPVHTDSGWVTIGPLVRPGKIGCPVCVRRRQSRNRSDARPRRLLHDQLRAAGDPADDSMIAPLLPRTVAELVRAELGAVPGSARTEAAVLRLSVVDGSLRRHRFLPDPACPRCGEHRPVAAENTLPQRTRLAKVAVDSFRLTELSGRSTQLRERYVDAETGVIGSTAAGLLGGVPTVVARVAPAQDQGDGQHGYGRAADFRSAEVTALVEALERRGGEHPGGHRAPVRGSYADLADRAVDPRRFGTHAPEQYELPDYPFRPFDPDQETSWVWGYSFAQDRAVLVPEALAYYGRRSPADPGWVYETSNGCAVGSALPEAIFHGLLEIAERDAFLMTWYARLAAPPVDLDSAVDRRIPLTAQLVEQRLGYRVMVFSTMLEHRVPTFLALALDPSAAARPALAMTAAAHPVPEQAALAALRELAPLVAGLQAGFDPGTVAPMLQDSSLVREMADHARLYTHPATRARISFLADGDRSPLALATVADQAAWPEHDDLWLDVDELAGRYLAQHQDVIAVDTTSSEQSAGGFASAKVLVTGTLPMTFGHQFRRITGLPRLFTVPRLLGYRDRDLPLDAVNPYPHPFP